MKGLNASPDPSRLRSSSSGEGEGEGEGCEEWQRVEGNNSSMRGGRVS